MIKIGIVRNIGSGKSFISKKFGYPVFSADLEVKKLYKTLFKKDRRYNIVLPWCSWIIESSSK